MTDYRERAVDAVICDVGEVILVFGRRVAAEIEKRFGLGEGKLLEVLLKSPATKQATVGLMDQREWLQRVTEEVPEGAVKEWLDYHGELNAPLVEMLAARRGGILLALLSNATQRLWADLAYHGLEDFADVVFCSADIGLAKPEPDAYRLVAQVTSVPLERTLYIDDTASWVQVGRDLGMHGHVYRTVEGLNRTLIETGVLR